jgi:PTH2 family peptidyl-tRNA hydrolase
MPKQVIVMRKDLNMRKGKMIAQGAHASMKFLVSSLTKVDHDQFNLDLGFEGGREIKEWLGGRFKKICVGVNSEEELVEIFEAAKAANIPCAMVEDCGLTEFNGVETKTCCGIGPGDSDEIDKITGHLKLL